MQNQKISKSPEYRLIWGNDLGPLPGGQGCFSVRSAGKEDAFFPNVTKCGNAQDHSSLDLQLITAMNPENVRIGQNQRTKVLRQGEKEGEMGRSKEKKEEQ